MKQSKERERREDLIRKRINKILKYQIILADTDIHIHFEKVIQPFLDAILENSVENETLSQIRDELLPKLLSGEIEL